MRKCFDRREIGLFVTRRCQQAFTQPPGPIGNDEHAMVLVESWWEQPHPCGMFAVNDGSSSRRNGRTPRNHGRPRRERIRREKLDVLGSAPRPIIPAPTV